MKFTLELRDDNQGDTSLEIEEATLEMAISSAQDEAQYWATQGDWGDAGARITVWWELFDEDGEEVESGNEVVDIEPNHDNLIKRVGGDVDCDHDWSSEDEGGCDENPGVWSTGGTNMLFRSHCKNCGLIRIEKTTGSQYNPGEHNTVRYELHDSNEALI